MRNQTGWLHVMILSELRSQRFNSFLLHYNFLVKISIVTPCFYKENYATEYMFPKIVNVLQQSKTEVYIYAEANG